MASTLSVNVFTAPEKTFVAERSQPFGPPPAWDPMTSTLIFGEEDAVLVDALTTTAEAEALAAWVQLHHRNLTTIYITHGHLDHFAGLSVLLHHFPDARAIATAATVEYASKQAERLPVYRKMWPDQLPTPVTVPGPWNQESFSLEGHELRIIELGQTDAVDSTSLHVPDLDLVVGGDALYNRCHMFVAATTPESRENWITALDRLSALNPVIAVAGHKKPGAPDTPDTIALTRQYLTDFGRLQQETGSDRELYDAMTGLYPDWASHQAWLMFGF
ncbi:MBL fold metallo-hydrolase [Streptomyces sp. NPDC093509]|uniref:MBL fold metallo-hydrolase n=1 Tax=Streptomyces sp. NPDC093509 TaxID=3154982 RepID=UPI003450EC8E